MSVYKSVLITPAESILEFQRTLNQVKFVFLHMFILTSAG